MTDKNYEEYDFPVWVTQCGGLARETEKDKFVFVETPPGLTEFSIGDNVPEDWGIASANELAKKQLLDEGCGQPKSSFEKFDLLDALLGIRH